MEPSAYVLDIPRKSVIIHATVTDLTHVIAPRFHRTKITQETNKLYHMKKYLSYWHIIIFKTRLKSPSEVLFY